MKIKISLIDDDGNLYEGVVQLKKKGKDKNRIIPVDTKKWAAKKTIKQPKSIMDFLMLLKAKGFFNTPKSRKDIVSGLAKINKHYESTSIDEPLRRAFKSKKLGRISKKGLYLYVSR